MNYVGIDTVSYTHLDVYKRQVIKKRCEELAEFNPMLGHRGCRLAVTYPEIAVMQTKAIINAAIAVNKEGLNVEPEIMIPLVGALNEFRTVKQTIVETADEVIKAAGVELKYTVGTVSYTHLDVYKRQGKSCFTTLR